MVQHSAVLDPPDPLSRTLRALADPNRRAILAALAHGPTPAGALAGPLALSVPGILKHVRLLEDADLVRTTKEGRSRVCRLGPARLDDVADLVATHRSRLEARLDRFEAYLATLPATEPLRPAPLRPAPIREEPT